jgi:hypothetical protein
VLSPQWNLGITSRNPSDGYEQTVAVVTALYEIKDSQNTCTVCQLSLKLYCGRSQYQSTDVIMLLCLNEPTNPTT